MDVAYPSSMAYQDGESSNNGRGSVVKRRQALLGCAAGCLFSLFLSSLTGCGSSCSDNRKAGGGSNGPCSDMTHFVACVGGEGYEHDEIMACPSETPHCADGDMPGYNHVCK